MNPTQYDEGWEDRLRAGLGECPGPDFEAWQARNANALAALGTSPLHRFLSDRKILMYASRCIAALLLLTLGGFWLYPGGNLGRAPSPGPSPESTAPAPSRGLPHITCG